MGLLKSLFGSRESKKWETIKEGVIKRFSGYQELMKMSGESSRLPKISKEQLLGTPEATIITIVENYYQGMNHGLSEHETFQRIEMHRSMGGSGIMPDPVNLESYVNYRMGIEYKDAPGLSDVHVKDMIESAKSLFSLSK